MKIYGSAVKIILTASRSDHSLDRYFKATQIVLNYFSELFQRLTTGDKIFHIARLFRDSTDWDELLTAAFQLSAQLPDIISKTNIKINKVSFGCMYLMLCMCTHTHTHTCTHTHTHTHIQSSSIYE